VLFVRLEWSYFVTLISTRRFLARPASVVFGITGLVSAAPMACAFARSPSARALAAFDALSSESSLFDGNFFFSAPWIGRLPVWPFKGGFDCLHHALPLLNRASHLWCESPHSRIVRNLGATVTLSGGLSERRGFPSIISLRLSALRVVLEALLS